MLAFKMPKFGFKTKILAFQILLIYFGVYNAIFCLKPEDIWQLKCYFLAFKMAKYFYVMDLRHQLVFPKLFGLQGSLALINMLADPIEEERI